MQYNYDFEIVSLLVMVIILLHFAFIRQFPVDKTRVFGMLLLACTAECGVNILFGIGLANATLIPQFMNELLAFVFFLLKGLSMYLLFYYFVTISGLEDKKKKIVSVSGRILCLLYTIMVILTPFIGFFYYFKDGICHRGFGAGMDYACIICYSILDIVVITRRYHVVKLRTKLIILVYTIMMLAMVGLQYFIRDIVLTGVNNAVLLLMLYLAMQNPSELLDPVTNVGNETAFLAQMRKVLGHKTEQTVITIHLRQFHHIHAVLGIENSNLILRDVGTFLYRLCGKFHVYRTSSDTFTVLADTAKHAEVICTSLEERFSQDWIVRENRIMLDMEIILQHYPEDFQTISEYFGMRQFLIEQVAEAGTHAVLEADASYVERYRRRTKIEMAILRAIHEKSFEVYYQPIYSVQEKRIVSLEALVRLHDEEWGYISPEEFISIAERDGNIIHIGEQILEECCKFLARHILSNGSLGIRTIQLNISMVQCLRQNLAETIIPVLEHYHVPPSMIMLELTERTAISAPRRLKMHMEELGKHGITFAMDDYGSGNSNCSYLIQFPFREVKIDKDIVGAYFENETAKVVLKNEIRTMKQLGIPLIVEGIETKEQSEEMERLGVDYIQGYYYGRPLPEKECLRYIRSFNTNMEELF